MQKTIEAIAENHPTYHIYIHTLINSYSCKFKCSSPVMNTVKYQKSNTDQAEQRRYCFKRYLVIQECTHGDHTKHGRKDGLPVDGDL